MCISTCDCWEALEHVQHVKCCQVTLFLLINVAEVVWIKDKGFIFHGLKCQHQNYENMNISEKIWCAYFRGTVLGCCVTDPQWLWREVVCVYCMCLYTICDGCVEHYSSLWCLHQPKVGCDTDSVGFKWDLVHVNHFYIQTEHPHHGIISMNQALVHL